MDAPFRLMDHAREADFNKRARCPSNSASSAVKRGNPTLAFRASWSSTPASARAALSKSRRHGCPLNLALKRAVSELFDLIFSERVCVATLYVRLDDAVAVLGRGPCCGAYPRQRLGWNAAILRSPAGVLLIGAGIGPRTLSERLDGTGIHLAVSALCLTHLYGSQGVAGTRTVASRGKWSDSIAAAETASSVRRHPKGEQ